MLEDTLTIVSNLAFIFPAVEAIERQRWLRAIHYMLIVLCSSTYHGCNSFTGGCVGLPPNTLRAMDFYLAQLVIPLTALYAIHWPAAWYAAETVAIFLVGFVLFILQRYLGDSIYVQMIVSGISFGGIFLYWAIYAVYRSRKGKRSRLLPKYNWEYFAAAIGTSGVAVVLFAAEMLNYQLYWAVHSLWHVDAALAQHLMLNIWPSSEQPIYLDDGNQKHRRRAVLNTAINPSSPGQLLPLFVVNAEPRRVQHITPRPRVVINQ